MLSKDQEQNVAEGSTAILAGRDVTIAQIGPTYAEVRDIALDVFRANSYELARVAKETASVRAEEITEEFLSKLQREHPAGLWQANDPDFQYALFTVQKEYARTGDKDLGDLLVDLLVDRSKQERRSLLQIVLNESLNTAPKLTEEQLAILSVILLFKYSHNNLLSDHELLAQFLDKFVAPFASKIVKNMAAYQHLSFTGCGIIEHNSMSLETILQGQYQGLFLKGFNRELIAIRKISIGVDPRFFMKCLNDPSKIQVRALNSRLLDKELETHAISPEDRSKIHQLFHGENVFISAKVREKCEELRPYMSDVFDTWSQSPMSNLKLTSVGIAIGHANIKRLVGQFADLSNWIN